MRRGPLPLFTPRGARGRYEPGASEADVNRQPKPLVTVTAAPGFESRSAVPRHQHGGQLRTLQAASCAEPLSPTRALGTIRRDGFPGPWTLTRSRDRRSPLSAYLPFFAEQREVFALCGRLCVRRAARKLQGARAPDPRAPRRGIGDAHGELADLAAAFSNPSAPKVLWNLGSEHLLARERDLA